MAKRKSTGGRSSVKRTPPAKRSGRTIDKTSTQPYKVPASKKKPGAGKERNK